MEFKSQICTTIEQSKQLLELGLKPETADMKIDLYYPDEPSITPKNVDIDWSKQDEFVPAWSLHRLMEIGDFVNVGFLNINKMFDCCIQMLEGQIKGGIINQDYINK